jgi:proline dehydrogenase
MLRRSFLYLSQQSWLRHWMEHSSVSRKFTSRFIAGRRLDEAIQVMTTLRRENMDASLDFLGENVTSLEEAAASRDSYLGTLEAIRASRLPATVSVKLTQLGLDFSPEACRDNVSQLVQQAAAMKTRVEIDMESSEYTDRTLDMICALLERFPGAVRAVIQAYLYRSEADIRRLNALGIPVRLCKGAYRESAKVAFPLKSEVDRNYVRLMRLLLEEGADPAIASHDERIVRDARLYISERKIPSSRFEFQMLYGIRRDLQKRLISEGFRLRLYVPYGDAWYPYFMRRLAERPANVLFIARNLLRS